jgi:hypothetical protein
VTQRCSSLVSENFSNRYLAVQNYSKICVEKSFDVFKFGLYNILITEKEILFENDNMIYDIYEFLFI